MFNVTDFANVIVSQLLAIVNNNVDSNENWMVN